MKRKQNMILMIGLMSLVIFSVIVAVMMYYKTQEKDSVTQMQVNAYVAKKTIHKGEKVGLEMIQLQSFPASYKGAESMAMGEILGRYAKEEILQNDLIRSEKLSKNAISSDTGVEPVEPSGDMNASISGDRITLPASAFQNIDPKLKAGDHIDILSVSEEDEERHNFSGRYIALNVLVVDYKKHIPAPPKEGEKAPEKPAQELSELVLEMNGKEVSRLLSVYYGALKLNQQRSYNPDNKFRGHLWMVKCSNNPEKEDQAFKERQVGDKSMLPKRFIKTTSLKHMPQPQKGIVSYEQ